MAIIALNKKTFEKDIGKLNEELKEKIAMFGTPIEQINEDEIQIEIFPNRPDLLSYQGFKRSFLQFLDKKIDLTKYKPQKPQKNFTVKIDSSVKNIRPYTACAIAKDLDLNDEKIKELIEIQEKIHSTLGRKRKKLAIGIYPLEKIKLPITYKAMEPDKIKFLPLDSPKEMSGLEILQKHETGKEYSHLLAGKEKFPIFVDKSEKILSMPPIINSEETGRITPQTKEVFIECSGNDFETLKKCLNIICMTLIDMGSKIYQMELKYSKKEITPDFTTTKTNISVENTNKILGLNLTQKEINSLLKKMGHTCEKNQVKSPPYRTDILHEIDLIEDVAIAYGYDKFEPIIPKIPTVGEENKIETLKRKISEIISGLGYLEVSNYHLTSKRDQVEKMTSNEKVMSSDLIQLENSKTEYTLLRKDLTHYLLKNFSENVDTEYPQKIFEIGKIFKNKGEIIEKNSLAMALSPGNFTELKQVLDYLFRMMNLKYSLEESPKPPKHFINGRSGKIIVNKKLVGEIGEIHPQTLKNFKLKMSVALLEIDLDEILEKLI